MTTTYRSILISQPADGDMVFVRRFTRDPPILARWLAASASFITPTAPTITITGSAVAGPYATTYDPNWLGTGQPALSANISTYKVALWLHFGEGWRLEISDGATWVINTPQVQLTGGITGSATITSNGPAPISGVTSLSIGTLAAPILLLPANLVSAWRPQ